MAPPLTPVRTPVPPRSRRRRKPAGPGGPGTAGTNKPPQRPPSASAVAAAAASSGEKETPTVVFTATSPLPPPGGSGGAGMLATGTGGSGGATTTTTARSTATTAGGGPPAGANDGAAALFRPSQKSSGSSPGSRAGQSLEDESASSRGGDGRGGAAGRECSSDDSDCESAKNLRNFQAVSMIQNVLDGGIASICRLRRLFPPGFFVKMDVQGTTVTQFDRAAIERAVVADDACEGDSRPHCGGSVDDDEDDEASMVRSFHARTQRTLSPLTETTQKVPRSDDGVRSRAACDDGERRLAMEALLLLRWMQRDGVNEVLKDGMLACVHFGIRVPSDEPYKRETSADDDELLESYSFNISCNKPENPGEIDEAKANDATESFFKNLNGFQAGRSLSQSVVPSKTQSSFTQASRATSHCDTQTQFSDGHHSLSQKHHPSASQGLEASQKSLMASMSQSIAASVRASVRKNRGRRIPPNRYLTLRVDFTAMVERDQLPSALRPTGPCAAASSPSLLPSPVPIAGGTADGADREARDDGFVVTPLGRIEENGYSGLCVDMTAKTRGIQEEDNASISFSQFSNPFVPLSQVDGNGQAEEILDEYYHVEEESFQPFTAFTQAPEDGDTMESNVDAMDHPQKAAPSPYEDDGEGKEDHRPFTQPPEEEQAEKKESPVEVSDPSREASINCAGLFSATAPSQDARDEANDKENAEIEMGGKAFGRPYGLECAQKYVLCDVRDHRFVKSRVSGEREEYKCAFRGCRELEAAGKKKQWIPRDRMVEYGAMERGVRSALLARDYYLKERDRAGDSRIFGEVGEELNVDPGFVKKIARKRKSPLRETKNKRRKKLKA